MGTVSSRLGAFNAWVVENSDQAMVITRGKKPAIIRTSHGVDVRAILASREDTADVPAEHHVLGSPGGGLSVRSSVFVLHTVRHRPEQKLIVARVGAEVTAVHAPIEGCDERVMAVAATNLLVSIVDVINIHHAVVGAYRQVLITRADTHALDPFFRILENWTIFNMHLTVISSNDNGFTVRMNNYSSGALRVREGGQSRSSSPGELLGNFVDDLYSFSLAGLNVPNNDFIVVSGSYDAVLSIIIKAPDFSLIMRLHYFVEITVILQVDSARLAANKHLTVHTVDGSNLAATERAHLTGLSGDATCRPDFDSVSSSRIKFAFGVSDSADELLVSWYLLGGASVGPVIQASILTSSVSVSFIIPAVDGVARLPSANSSLLTDVVSIF